MRPYTRPQKPFPFGLPAVYDRLGHLTDWSDMSDLVNLDRTSMEDSGSARVHARRLKQRLQFETKYRLQTLENGPGVAAKVACLVFVGSGVDHDEQELVVKFVGPDREPGSSWTTGHIRCLWHQLPGNVPAGVSAGVP